MANNYNEFSCAEMREMLLNGELRHEYLTEDDYSDLIDNEMNYPEPLNEVINFCIDGLGRFEKYQELENINVDINALFKQVESERQTAKKRKLKRIPAVAAAAVAVVMLSQSVSLAFGFDLLGYIFKWNKEILHIESPNGSSNDVEPIYTAYEKIDEVPEELKIYISSYIWDNFTFVDATHLTGDDVLKLSFYFNHNVIEDINLSIYISKSINSTVEKDNDYLEEYEKNGIIYSIFKNLDYYKVVWVNGDLLYHVNVNLPLEEVKEVLDNF